MEWGLLRAALGKPRRFSLTFLRQVRLMCPSKETMLAPDAAQQIALRIQCRRLLNSYPASKHLRHQQVVCRLCSSLLCGRGALHVVGNDIWVPCCRSGQGWRRGGTQ